MLTIKTTITVLPNGNIQIPPTLELQPGVHHVVLMVDQPPATQAQPTHGTKPPLKLTMLDIGPWPEGFTVRREDMYDEDGR